MAQLNISPPKFTEADLDDAKQRQRIMSYLYKLDEQIRYVLNNLDAENFTEEYQKTIETASDKMERTFRDGQAKVMSRISQTAGEIRTEVADEVSGLQSQIDQTPEKIELAVKGIQIGGANYLLNSGTPVSNNKYAVADYQLGGPKPVEGETYTLRLWGELGDDREYFHAYNSSSTLPLARLTDNGDGTYSATFVWKNSTSAASVTPTFLRIYQRQSSGTTESTITRIKLEAGNKATDWSPAPEDTEAEFESVRAEIGVTKNEIKLAVEDVRVGGTQLLRNAGFYNGLAHWSKAEYQVNGEWRNLYFEPISPNDYRANEVPNMILHAQNETGMFGASQTVSLRKNTTYVLSGYVASHRNNRACIEIRNTTATRWALQAQFDVGWGGTNLGQYNHFEYTFDTADYTDYSICLYSNNFGENAYVWWAQIKLEEGNKASAWSPHPEDTQAGGENLLDDAELTISNGWVADDSSWNARNKKRLGFAGSGQDSSKDISANFGEIYITPGSYTVSCYAWQWNLGGVYPTLYFDMHSPDRTTFAQNVMATTLEDTASGGAVRKYTGTLNVTGYTGLVSVRFIIVGTFSQGDIGITEWKLERGNNATDWSPYREQFSAGTNVLINKDRFSVTTPEMNVNITSADGTERMLTINKDGIHAKRIDCPNVAQEYDGAYTLYVNPNASKDQVEAGNYYRSLADVARDINDKQLTQAMTINLTGSVGYNDVVTFRGICANTWVTIKGTSSTHAKLVGKLQLYFNSAAFRVQYLDIDTLSSELIGIEVVGRMQNAEIQNCVITGRGDATGAYGVNSRDGAMVNVSGCELYDLRRSLRSANGGLLVASNCKGNCSPGTNLANMHLSGTQACSNASTWTEHPIGGEIYKSSVTINQGSKPTPEAEATSVSYSATQSDVWAGGGWNNYSNSDIYQGYTSALGEHRGCFWFDNSTIRSALKNKTIKQVTLRLYQMSGSGRNQPVQVNLEGITVSYGGDQPFGATEHEYGVIGTTLGVNQTATFTIPTKAITHLVNGDINGFMLRTGETSVMTGDDNSYHYARFAGYDSGNRPVLTVTYA